MQTYRHTRRVEFAETDLAGLLHFSEFFRYMEAAEHALLRSLNHRVHQQTPDGVISFVRVHTECDYHKPFYFEDVVDVHVTVREVKTKSVVYDFIFRHADDPQNTDHAAGSITVVCIRKRDEGMSTIAIPDPIAETLRQMQENDDND